MSHLFRIDLTFTTEIFPSTVMTALLGGGWEMHHQNEIFYMVEGEGDYSWRFAASSEQADVLRRLDRAAGEGQHVAVAARWRGGSGGDLLFFPGESKISFTGSIERPILARARPFTDIGWYLERLLPPLLPLGLAELDMLDRP